MVPEKYQSIANAFCSGKEHSPDPLKTDGEVIFHEGVPIAVKGVGKKRGTIFLLDSWKVQSEERKEAIYYLQSILSKVIILRGLLMQEAKEMLDGRKMFLNIGADVWDETEGEMVAGCDGEQLGITQQLKAETEFQRMVAIYGQKRG